MTWPPEAPRFSPRTPSILAILDFIEFCYRAAGRPIECDYHQFFGHFHLTFNQGQGQAALRDDINRLFARNGLVYELAADGLVTRLVPGISGEALKRAVFQTGDSPLDFMLEAARAKFLDPDIAVRKEALEKLWDAWERLKTIEPGANKAASVKMLLDRVADEPVFRQFLEDEAKALTDAGNRFQIRHSEVNQTPLYINEHVDYMFHRMFSLIQLLLRRTRRGA